MGPSGTELGQWGGAVEGVGSLRGRVIEGRAWGGEGRGLGGGRCHGGAGSLGAGPSEGQRHWDGVPWGCSQTRCPDDTRSALSGVQLAGVLLQRDQGSADLAAEAGAVLTLQPAPALAHLPLLLPRGLQQLQPAALLERRLPDGWVPGPWGSRGGWAAREMWLVTPQSLRLALSPLTRENLGGIQSPSPGWHWWGPRGWGP